MLFGPAVVSHTLPLAEGQGEGAPAGYVGCDERDARGWTVSITIERAGQEVFSGRTRIDQIKRSFTELALAWLWARLGTDGCLATTQPRQKPPAGPVGWLAAP
jgi:hypothetical protein